MNVSVVVPVYRGAPSIPELAERLSTVLPTIAENYELVLVNDGSPDNSWQVIELLASKYRFVRGIDLMRNYGQHNALLAGVYSAKYEVIVTMDDDLQHPPEEIPKLVSALKDNVDLVYGREEKVRRGFVRRTGSRAIKWALAKLTGGGSHQDVGSFRAFRSLLRDAFPPAPGQFVILDSMLASGTTKLSSVEVSHAARKYGQSNYDIAALVRVAFRLITSYSVTPLRLAVVLGLACIGLGLISAISALFSPASWPTFAIIAAIAMFSGVQLCAIGVLGEYVGRLVERSWDRVPYAIRREQIAVKCVILQPSFIAWRGYFHQVHRADVFVFYDDVQYDKHGWRNRNKVKTANGTQWLTVPVHAKGAIDQGREIREITIDWTARFAEKHLATIKQAYRKAPFYDRYIGLLEQAYEARPEHLADLTIGLTESIARALGSTTKFARSSELRIGGAPTERLVNIVKHFGCDHYISGPSAKDYVEEDLFAKANIKLEYQTYDYPEYPQLHPPFDPQVSVLDLMFMMGDEAPRYIWGPKP